MPNQGTETLASYLDLVEQVKPWLQIPLTDTTRDAALNLIIDMACQWVQHYIGKPVAPITYGPGGGIGKFDGSGGLNSGYIMLPRRPVIEVVEVIEYQGSNPVTLTEVDPSTGNTGGDGYQVEYRTGRITRVLGGVWNRPFFPGSNNIWITWVAGYNPIPADIRMATLELVAHWFRNSQQVSREAIRPSGYDLEVDTPNSMWAGVPYRVESLLKPYLSIGIR